MGRLRASVSAGQFSPVGLTYDRNITVDRTTTLGQSVVAAYVFNEGSGTIARDFSGNENHARPAKAISLTSLFSSSAGAIPSGHVQGAATDGTDWYVAGTLDLFKLNSSFVQTAQRLNNVADLPATTPARQHNGSLAVHGGVVYVPIEYWSGTDGQFAAIGRYNASDLSYIGFWDISAFQQEISGLCVDATRELIWASDYVRNRIYCYRLDTGAFVESFPLDIPIVEAQGVAADSAGNLYLAARVVTGQSRHRIVRVDPNLRRVTGFMFASTVTNSVSIYSDVMKITTYSGGTPDRYSIHDLALISAPTWAASNAGYTVNQDWGWLMPTAIPDIGALVAGINPTSLYNFNGIWDNVSADNDDWESWIPSTGLVTSRISDANEGRTIATSAVTAGTQNQVIYTWDRTALRTQQYINGTSNPTGEVTFTTWTAPEQIVIGGHHGSNVGRHTFNYFYLFNKRISNAEAAALAADPFSIFTRPPSFR